MDLNERAWPSGGGILEMAGPSWCVRRNKVDV